MTARDRQVGGDHYARQQVQPWDAIDTWPLEQRIGFYRGNALKYVMRAGTKDPAPQDYAKARHYLDKLLEVLAENGPEQRGHAEPGLTPSQRNWPDA